MSVTFKNPYAPAARAKARAGTAERCPHSTRIWKERKFEIKPGRLAAIQPRVSREPGKCGGGVHVFGGKVKSREFEVAT
jgi:hypothetical protein